MSDFCENTEGLSDEGIFICETASTIGSISDGVDTFFLLFAGALVFLMQAGFAMLCAGSVRQKNVKNIMLKNLLDACGGAIGFYTLGYGFAYGDGSTFIGGTNFAIIEMSTGADYIGFFFQFAFAATAATIVAGTVAERCKMAAYLCYSLFLTAFVSIYGFTYCHFAFLGDCNWLVSVWMMSLCKLRAYTSILSFSSQN